MKAEEVGGERGRFGRVVMYVFKLRSVTDLAVYINGASSTPFLLTGLYASTVNIYNHEIS